MPVSPRTSRPPPAPQECAATPDRARETLTSELANSWTCFWRSPGRFSINAVPPDLADRYDDRSHKRMRREWASYEVDWPSLKPQAENLPRYSAPDRSAATMALSKKPILLDSVESAARELGSRMKPWFGIVPRTATWVATRTAPRMTFVSHWLSELEDIVQEDLAHAGMDVSFTQDRSRDIPQLWRRVASSLVRYEVASSAGLCFPKLRALPGAVRGISYSALANPFWPLVDIWRCGVLIEGALMQDFPDSVVLYVHRDALTE